MPLSHCISGTVQAMLKTIRLLCITVSAGRSKNQVAPNCTSIVAVHVPRRAFTCNVARGQSLTYPDRLQTCDYEHSSQTHM